MAEIKIKKKSPVWPWIVFVVIILAALAYYFMVYEDGNMDGDKPNIGQDEQIENGTGHNSFEIDKAAYPVTIMAWETVA